MHSIIAINFVIIAIITIIIIRLRNLKISVALDTRNYLHKNRSQFHPHLILYPNITFSGITNHQLHNNYNNVLFQQIDRWCFLSIMTEIGAVCCSKNDFHKKICKQIGLPFTNTFHLLWPQGQTVFTSMFSIIIAINIVI